VRWCAAPQFRGAAIEVLNHARGVNGIDSHGTQLEQGAKVFFTGAQCFPCPLAFGDVHKHVDTANNLTFGIAQRGRIRSEPAPRAVWPLDDGFDTAKDAAFFERDGHRALIMGHGRAIGMIELPAYAPLIIS